MLNKFFFGRFFYSQKKGATKRVRLGRPGTSLKMGLLGMANIGKSSTFNCLSNLNVPAQNIPFCTIDPNTAYISVQDPRFKSLCEMYRPAKQTGPILRIVDIAGLVKGASEGYGLGNQFLSHVMQVDALYHVIRAFPGQKIAHTQGSMDPIRDIQIIKQELIQKDIEIVTKKIKQLSGKASRTQDQLLKKQFEVLKRVNQILKEKEQIRNIKWSNQQIEALNKFLFFTAKPMVYLLNMSNKAFLQDKLQNEEQILDTISENGKYQARYIKYSVQYEQDPDKDLKKSKINQIIKAGYEELEITHYYTVGTDEVRAWAIRNGDTALQAAGKIHSDFTKGFINAQVIHADTLIAHPEYMKQLSKQSKKQGKTYIVKQGDILHFNCKFK